MSSTVISEVHTADPIWRRQWLWLIAGLLLGTSVLLLLYRWGLDQMLQHLAMRRVEQAVLLARWMGGGMALLLCLSSTLLAWISLRTAAQILQQDRFPPAQARVIRDTPVRRGEAARRRARLLQVIAAMLPLTAVLATALMIQLLLSLS